MWKAGKGIIFSFLQELYHEEPISKKSLSAAGNSAIEKRGREDLVC
jgi:hypothetical protein